MSARKASDIASNPKEANPKVMQGIIRLPTDITVIVYSEIDSMIIRTRSTFFLPNTSDNLPLNGPLKSPATLSIETRKNTSNSFMLRPLPK